MKRNILALLALLFLAACSAQAADELFKANEFSVRLAIINPADLGNQDALDFKAKSLAGFEVGMGYYVTRWAGAEVNIPVWRSDDRCFQSVSAGAMFRLPMDMLIKGDVWRHLAPYGRVGLAYSECWTSPYSVYAGAGLEVRVNKRFGFFGGAKYSRRGAFAPGAWNDWSSELGARIAF